MKKLRQSSTLNRDSYGRFLARGCKDPELERIEKRIAATNKLAELYLKILELIGQSNLAEGLGIRRWDLTGDWRIGHAADTFFSGIIAGIYFAVKKIDENKMDAIATIAELSNEVGVMITARRLEA